jgi:hypothetical protein
MVEEMKKIPRDVKESTPDELAPVSQPYVGITFISPAGTKYFLTVGDDGSVITTEVV